MLLLSLFACQEKETEPTPQELYDTYCGLCHGYEGEGYLAEAANALGNPEFLSIASDEFLIHATVLGRPETKMSAWSESEGGPLSSAQIEDIVGYIRAWQTTESKDIDFTVEGNIENGLQVYEEHCLSCHGEDGSGGSALSLNSPTFLEAATDGFLWYSIVDGRSGTTMQSYEAMLSEEETSDLVALIRAWEE